MTENEIEIIVNRYIAKLRANMNTLCTCELQHRDYTKVLKSMIQDILMEMKTNDIVRRVDNIAKDYEGILKK